MRGHVRFTSAIFLLWVVVGCAGGSSDGGASAAPAATPTPTGRPGYTRLSETGLYSDFAARTLAPGVRPFRPTHFLWSDGSEKERWIRLPEGTQVDSSDMDHWRLPIGTQVFKQFSLGGVRLETRLIQRYGPEPEDFWMGAFVWLADGSDAVLAADGAQNVLGTPHDVPNVNQCLACHQGEPGRLLGFSAVQLSGEREGVTLASLIREGLLNAPPPAGTSYAAPGDATTAAALGYIHANCGHCHNPNGPGFLANDMQLRLSVDARTPEETSVYRTAVGQPLSASPGSRFVFRIRPGFPEESAIWHRMMVRDVTQMPPIATEFPDPQGLEMVASWILSLR